jgi:Mrp family chromosome partitioning ATPase
VVYGTKKNLIGMMAMNVSVHNKLLREKISGPLGEPDIDGYFDVAKKYAAEQIERKKTPVTVGHKLDKKWLHSQRVMTSDTDKMVLNSYKLLRTQILKQFSLNGWDKLAVVSARSGQGATLTATNLAMCVSKLHGYTAVLADLNFSNPNIHKYIGLKPEFGISDCEFSSGTLDQILVGIDDRDMVVLPNSKEVVDSSDVMMSPKFEALMSEVSARYNKKLVIMDMPPILESDDVIAYSDHWDAVLVVVQEGVTTKSDLERVSEVLSGRPVVGVLYNDASL